jgi:hypothetical protein
MFRRSDKIYLFFVVIFVHLTLFVPGTLTFFAQIFIEVRTSGDNLSVRPAISGYLYKRWQSRRASARVFLYTQLLFLDILDANSRS